MFNFFIFPWNLSRKSIALKSILFLALFIAIHSYYYAWSGKVVGASDGDTIEVLLTRTSERIRLYGIYCPDKRQTFGKKAKQFTPRMVFKKTVDVKPVIRDRYGRTIVWEYFNGKCLNEELLKAGLAWHYKGVWCRVLNSEKVYIVHKLT